jgi:hypothetical protein
MAYIDPNGYLLVLDKVGTSTANPVPAPDAGETLIYATPQGLVAEKAAATWYLDKPVSVAFSGAGVLTGTASYVSLLAAPFTIPDSVESDSTTATTYCADLNFAFAFTGATAASAGFYVQAYLAGVAAADFFIAANGSTATTGTAVVRWWFSAASGTTVDFKFKKIASGDTLTIPLASTQARYALIRRDFAA